MKVINNLNQKCNSKFFDDDDNNDDNDNDVDNLQKGQNVSKIKIYDIYSVLESGCLAYPGLTTCRLLFFFVVDWLPCSGVLTGVGSIGSGKRSDSDLTVN